MSSDALGKARSSGRLSKRPFSTPWEEMPETPVDPGMTKRELLAARMGLTVPPLIPREDSDSDPGEEMEEEEMEEDAEEAGEEMEEGKKIPPQVSARALAESHIKTLEREKKQYIRGLACMMATARMQVRGLTPLETLSRDYVLNELLAFHDPSGPWSPCLNSTIDPDKFPHYGCVAQHMWTGAPLREFAYMAEHIAVISHGGRKKPPSMSLDVRPPRLCFLCMLELCCRQSSAPLETSPDQDLLDGLSIQPCTFDDKEWLGPGDDPSSPGYNPATSIIIYPSNVAGHPNRLVAPFLNFKVFFARLRCVIVPPSVSPPLSSLAYMSV
jgi:hypothetical protein